MGARHSHCTHACVHLEQLHAEPRGLRRHERLLKNVAQLLHTEISEFLLRKAAHFSEYGLLGVEFSLLLGLQHDKNGKNLQCGRNLLDFPLIGMLCAVTDETIQIFSGRGSLVSDVWIDTAGFSTGFFLTVLLFLFINHCKKSRVTGNRKG